MDLTDTAAPTTPRDDGGGARPEDVESRGTPLVVDGIVLRSALVLHLRSAGVPLRIRDLVVGLEHAGFATRGRASKEVSDALRWECRRGRVRRVARGTYTLGHVPRQTAARMRHRVAAARCRSEA